MLLYLTVTVELARRKLIWTDEFFTLFLGRLNASELWTALLTGGDQHPPPFYLMHHLFLRDLRGESLCLAAAGYARVPSDDGVSVSLCRETDLGRIRSGCDADTARHGRL